MGTPLEVKAWLRASLSQFWPLIKQYIGAQVQAAKEELQAQVGSITGSFKGAFDTFAALPATAKNGEWAVLSKDDGTNESGIYVKGANGWTFVADITGIDEVQALLGTDADFAAGTATDKLATIKQIADALATKANKGGSDAQAFLVADAEVDSKQAVNASQFKVVTASEAAADWAAAATAA